MEAGDTKEQEKNQQINELQQKSEITQAAFEGESEVGKTETAEKEAKEDRKFAEETGKVVNKAEKAEVAAGNEVHEEKTFGETEATGIEAKQKEDSTEEASESEKGTISKGSQKEKVAKDNSQPEPEGVSETKDDTSGKPEDLQEVESGKGDVLKKNVKAEGRTGSTSDEPLSPEAEEEEEEFWPEFPPRSPEASPQSPTELKSLETGGITPASPAREAASEDTASPEAALKGEKEPPSAAPEEAAAAAKEKKKRPAFDRREITRPRMPSRGQSRKAIVEKFGGAATGPAPNIKRTGAVNTVKTMLLEWCRAMTRGYEHVDIQNFSTSWKSGMAFCALIHKFFPDAFDYADLDPANRKENFTLAFSTAE